MKHLKTLAIVLAAATSLSTMNLAEASHSRTTTRTNNESWSGHNLPSKARAEISRLQKQDPLDVIPIPILFGVEPGDFTDTWGEARSGGRSHEGTDIMAPKGSHIVAPTKSVVSNIGEGANGGLFVYTTNPGGERYYFAHLDDYADGLKEGDILEAGDLIGYVGNTGNASAAPSHLHFGIYANGAQNPFERLSESLATKVRIRAVEEIIKNADDEGAEARILVGNNAAFFRQAALAGTELPEEITLALANTVATKQVANAGGAAGARDLTLGSQGADVTKLQAMLIAEAKGSAAATLKNTGATGYFGPMTQAALSEWQAAVKINPTTGYFGPLSRAKMTALSLL